jgi:HEAT repeat protein
MEAAVPVLMEALTDPDSSVREMACWGFHYMGRRAGDAIPGLIQLFNSPTQPPDVRVQALEAFSSIGSNGGGVRPADPSSIAVAMQDVVNLLGDSNPVIRAQASITLGSMGTYAKPAVPSLVSMIEAENIQTRMLAAATAGQIGPSAQEAVPALSELLTYSASRDDALAQLTALGQNPSQVGEVALAAKLNELTRSARAAGAVALGRIGPGAQDSVPALIAIMNDTANGGQSAPLVENQIPFYPLPQDNSESELRVKAAIALWQIAGSGGGAKLIAETLYPPRPDLNWWDERLNVLAEMGPAAQGAVPILQAMRSFRDDQFHVPAQVLAALQKIAPEPLPTPNNSR